MRRSRSSIVGRWSFSRSTDTRCPFGSCLRHQTAGVFFAHLAVAISLHHCEGTPEAVPGIGGLLRHQRRSRWRNRLRLFQACLHEHWFGQTGYVRTRRPPTPAWSKDSGRGLRFQLCRRFGWFDCRGSYRGSMGWICGPSPVRSPHDVKKNKLDNNDRNPEEALVAHNRSPPGEQ